MLAELFKAIGEQALHAATPKAFHPDAEPKHVYWLGSERHEADPSPRDHKAADLETFGHWLTEHAPPDGDASEAHCCLWYDRTGVVLLVHEPTRRDRVTLALSPSPQMLALEQLERGKAGLTQAEILKLLRTTFADCMAPAGDLLGLLKSIKFKSLTDGHSKTDQGKRSVGKTIEQEISGLAPIPEEVALLVPVFAQASLQIIRATVRLYLDADPATERFALYPLAGELELAYGHGEQQLGDRLADVVGAVPCYRGKA